MSYFANVHLGNLSTATPHSVSMSPTQWMRPSQTGLTDVQQPKTRTRTRDRTKQENMELKIDFKQQEIKQWGHLMHINRQSQPWISSSSDAPLLVPYRGHWVRNPAEHGLNH